MHCEIYREQIELYAEGELDEENQRQLEAHLSACRTCREDLETTRRLFALLKETSAIQPPADLSDSIFHQIQPPWHKRWFAFPIWIPVSAVLLILAGWFILKPALMMNEPSEQEIAQALEEVRYALSIVNYATQKTNSTLAELQGQIQPSKGVREQIASAERKAGEGISRGLSIALNPLSRITSFEMRSSP